MKDKKRYFLVSYFGVSVDSVSFQHGNISFDSDVFVNNKKMIEWLMSEYNIEDAVITNIYEFKSKSDYDDFREE